MIIAALLGALTFGACVDTEESSSVKAIRDAKAEQLKSLATLNNAKAQAEATIAAAEAQIAAAQAQLIAAQAAAINAQTEAEKIKNQLAAAQAEAEIAALQAQLELDLLDYQQQLLQAKLDFNKAMQQLTADEKANLEGIYTAYNTALENIATTKTAIADANAEIAKVEAAIAKLDADKNWEDVVKAAQKKVTDAQKAVTDTEAKLNAKKSAYANIEAMGGINYAVLAAQIEDATEAKDAAIKAYAYALKNVDTKSAAALKNYNAINSHPYYTLLYNARTVSRYIGPAEISSGSINANGSITIGTTNSIVDDESNQIGWGYKKAGLNNNGQYVANGDDVVLYGVEAKDYIQDEYGNDCEEYYVSYYAPNTDGINGLFDENEKIISTSSWAKDLEVAELKLAAWEKATEYDELVDIYEAYLEDVKEIKAEIAEKEAQIAANNYLISIYEDTGYDGNDEEYEDEIEDLEEENDELEEDLDDLNDELDDLEDELEDDLDGMYAENENEVKDAIDEYKGLVADVEAAQEAYDDVLAWEAVKAAFWAQALEAYAEVQTLVANDVVLAQAVHDAHVACDEAYDAKVEAEEYLSDLEDIWSDLANAPADSVEDMMNAELQALAAEISTLEATLKTNKKTLEDAQKAADKLAAMTEEEIAESKEKYLADAIEAYEADIEALEAEIVLLEQDLKVYELELAGLTAALNDALAE